jgi:peptidoglycan/xylan/chitin deacetylase (PgdA/CDA1 family)
MKKMGILKSGWLKGVFLLILVAGFLFAGIFANHYFRAKAAANETINQPKSGLSNQTRKAAETINQGTKDYQLEKEWMQKQQNKAVSWNRQNSDKVIAHVPENKPAANDTAKAPPASNKPVISQVPAKDISATKSVQKPTQPANSSKRTVYLTFDDGPQFFSKDIIALLEKYHFKATFFMLDPNIKKYPDAVKLMVQTGEGIGSHGVTHDRKLFYASVSSVLGEMDQTRNTLKTITGIDTFLIRTPYGSAPDMTPEYKKAVWNHGYLMWDWNIDSRDWYFKDQRYINNVIAQINARANRNGPIVILLHEKRETLAYLPQLFNYLSKQNFACKAIDGATAPIHF